MTTTVPAGWYPDPDEGGENRLRWFDGRDWTETTAPGPTPHERRMLAIAERESRSWRKVRRLIWWPILAVIVFIVLAFLVALIAVAAS